MFFTKLLTSKAQVAIITCNDVINSTLLFSISLYILSIFRSDVKIGSSND
jgi:hypothetical protein